MPNDEEALQQALLAELAEPPGGTPSSVDTRDLDPGLPEEPPLSPKERRGIQAAIFKDGGKRD